MDTFLSLAAWRLSMGSLLSRCLYPTLSMPSGPLEEFVPPVVVEAHKAKKDKHGPV